MGYFQTYAATAGLERFPEDKQFFVYLAVHKKLKAEDLSYRAACRRYNLKIIGVTLALNLILLLLILLPQTLFGPVAEVVLTLGGIILYVPWLLIVSFRHQRWMNERIAERLRRKPHANPGDRALHSVKA